jgi:hypothetical protein
LRTLWVHKPLEENIITKIIVFFSKLPLTVFDQKIKIKKSKILFQKFPVLKVNS